MTKIKDNPDKEKIQNVKEVLSKIKKAIEIKSPDFTKEVETSHEQFKQGIKETIEAANEKETAKDPVEEIKEIVTEATSEPANIVEEKKSGNVSLFDTLKQSTEEDSKPEDKSRLEHFADSISDKDLLEEDLDLNEESPKVQKEMADVKATTIVEFGELVMSLIAMWIADDWSIKAQEEKFIISNQKKKAIKISIMRVILAKKKKTNPNVAILLLCLGACVPMLVVAFLTRINKKRAHKEQMELIQAEKELHAAKTREAAKEYVEKVSESDKLLKENINSIENPEDKNGLKVVKIAKHSSEAKKETRGRHKNSCAIHKGKKCNCKN